MLMDELWGYDSESDPRTVDTHIRRLREKLAGVPESVIRAADGSDGFTYMILPVRLKAGE